MFDLHSAIGYDNISEIRALISAGADVNAVNDKGETPLILAKKVDNTYMIKILKEAGAE